VDNYNPHISHKLLFSSQIFHILTGSLLSFSIGYQQKAPLHAAQKTACEKQNHIQQVSMPQKHSFPPDTCKKNRVISGQNRLSTFSQPPTAATTANIPLSYLILLCSLART
jgi:hypothetical protein